MKVSSYILFAMSVSALVARADLAKIDQVTAGYDARCKEWQVAFDLTPEDKRELLLKNRPSVVEAVKEVWKSLEPELNKPEATPAIVWMFSNMQGIAEAYEPNHQQAIVRKMLKAVAQYHIKVKGIGGIMPALAGSVDPTCATVMQKIFHHNPNDADKGMAALAYSLTFRERTSMKQDNPNSIDQRVSYLRKAIELAYDEPFGSTTVAKVIEEESYEIKNLCTSHIAPSIAVQTLDGSLLNSPNGKPTLIVFWSLNDVVSKSLAQQIAVLRKQYPELELLSVCSPLRKDEMEILKALDFGGVVPAVDQEGRAFKQYRINQVPSVYLVDAQGAIRLRGVPDTSFPSLLDVTMKDIKANPVVKKAGMFNPSVGVPAQPAASTLPPKNVASPIPVRTPAPVASPPKSPVPPAKPSPPKPATTPVKGGDSPPPLRELPKFD